MQMVARFLLSLLLLLLLVVPPAHAYFSAIASTILYMGTFEYIYAEPDLIHQRSGEAFIPIELINNSWEPVGDVTTEPACFENEPCFILGGSQENYENAATITQNIEIGEAHPSTLVFALKTDYSEYLPGFDSPYFQVFINNLNIYEEHFSTTIPNGGWRQIFLPLPNLDPGIHTITFVQQNTGDDQFPSIVSLAAISTDAILFGSQDKIIITGSNNNLISAQVFKSNGSETYLATTQLTLGLEVLNQATGLEYWPENNPERSVQINLSADLSTPDPAEVTRLAIEHDQQLSLVINQPDDAYAYLLSAENLAEIIRLFPAAKFKNTTVLTIPINLLNYEYPTLTVMNRAGNASPPTSLNSPP